MNSMSKELAHQIAVDFLKKKRNTEKIDVSEVEKEKEVWIIRGTCPIDLEGHPWAEKFKVIVDQKGKVISTDFSLL